MYQSIIRDSGGECVVRRIGDVICPDGSIIMVPPGVACIVAVNGVLSPPLSPGRYTVNPGLSPFFSRFHNILTGGEAPVGVDIYYITVSRVFMLSIPTEEFVYIEDEYHLHVHASSACSVAMQIREPGVFLHNLCGYQREFEEQDFNPFLLRLIVPRLREKLAEALAGIPVTAIQARTGQLGRELSEEFRSELASWGICLHDIRVLTVNVRESDVEKIVALDERKASGNLDIDLDYRRKMRMLEAEVQEIERIYGDVQTRTVVEALRNLTANPGLASNPGAVMAMMPMAFWTNDSVFKPIREQMEQIFQASWPSTEGDENRGSVNGQVSVDNAGRPKVERRNLPKPVIKKE